MTVYLEDALLENFLLDAVLLYLALRLAKTKISLLRVLLSSSFGAGIAVLFPLLPLKGVILLLLKVLFGLVLVLLCVKERNLRVYAFVSLSFFGETFLFGGLILSLCSVFSISYQMGEGYILESVPIGLILSAGIFFVLLCLFLSKRMYKYIKRRRNLVPCKLISGEREYKLQGFVDSGNNLLFRGEPVSVIPPLLALALFQETPPAGRMTISTVAGSKETPVFTLEKLVLCGVVKEHVYIAVGDVPSKEHSLILHTALLGGFA